MAHFRALLQQLDDLRMHVETRWRTNEAIRDFRKFCAGQAGVHFKRGIVFSEMVWRPIIGKLAKIRSLCELACFALFLFVFLFNELDSAVRGKTGRLRIDFPERRVILNALVEARLGDRSEERGGLKEAKR